MYADAAGPFSAYGNGNGNGNWIMSRFEADGSKFWPSAEQEPDVIGSRSGDAARVAG